MTIECPRCRQSFEVPNEWAGKRVRCQGCKEAFTLPVPDDAVDDSAFSGAPPDALLHLEQARARPEDEHFETQDFEGSPSTITATADKDKKGAKGPLQRNCPHCGKPIRVIDQYTDVLCSHCQSPVPAMIAGETLVGGKGARDFVNVPGRSRSRAGFYDGFLSAFVYPIPAIISILGGMGVAGISIFVPIAVLLGLAIGSGLNPITEPANVTWVKPLLTLLFLAEAIYFGGVGYYVLIDSIRATGQGLAKPPPLTWNLTSVATALAGYVGLAAYYLVIALIVVYVANSGTFHLPTTLDEIERYRSPGYLTVFAIVTFAVPMNVIGMASGRLSQGFNPYRVFRSIGRTFGHYLFLFLIVCLYLTVYVGLMAWIVGWAIERIFEAIGTYSAEGSQSFVEVAVGLGAWAVLVGVGLYFAYVMGRLLGLFVQSYGRDLLFEI